MRCGMDNNDKQKKNYLSGVAKFFNGVSKKPDSTFTDFSHAFKSTFSYSSQPLRSPEKNNATVHWEEEGEKILDVLKAPNSLMFKLGNVHKNKIAMATKLLNNSLHSKDKKLSDLLPFLINNLFQDLDEMKKSNTIKDADRMQIIQFEDKLKACMKNTKSQLNLR